MTPSAQGWSPDDEARLIELLRWETNVEPLRAFMRRVSPHLKAERHLEPVLDVFERTRHERVRAIIAMPPRHGKTVTAMHGVAWRVAVDPGLRHAYATYGDSLSVTGSRAMRRLAVSSGVDLAKDAAALHDWRTEQDGGVLATGVGGPLTGKGVTGIALVDDAFKNRKDAESRLKRDSVWEWFTDVVWTRLEDDASCLVIGTMWHVDDLINRLITRGAGDDGVPFELIRLPAIAEAGEVDILGRAVGEALWPATVDGRPKFPLKKLEEIRKILGEYSWASLYQNRPRPRGTQVFGEPGRFRLAEWKLDGHRMCVCADPAATKKTTADYTAGLVLAVKGYGHEMVGWVVGHIRGQWEIPDNPHEGSKGVVSRLRELQLQWGGVAVVVEAVAGFKSVPQMLRAVDPNIRVVEAPAVTDKFTRAQPAAAAWNTGRLLIPTDAPWADGLIKRFKAFTGNDDPEDDEIDACAHGWNALFAPLPPRDRGGQRSANPFG